MKILTALVFAISIQAQAATPPKVECHVEVIDSRQADNEGQGADIHHARLAVTDRTVAKIKDFDVALTLSQVCAADGGPCLKAYNLSLSVQRGDVASSTFSTVWAEQSYDRRGLTFQYGQERLTLLCDVNMPVVGGR